MLIDETTHYRVQISTEALRMHRAENDNELMNNLREVPLLHRIGIVVGGFGLVVVLTAMFVNSLASLP